MLSLILKGLPILQKERFIFCDVHGYHYECAGHPQVTILNIFRKKGPIGPVHIPIEVPYSILQLLATHFNVHSSLLFAQEFYIIVLIVALVCLFAYLVCTVYNLMWLIIPNMSPLSRVMARYRSHVTLKGDSPTDAAAALGELYHVYYNNRDLKLLLNLLTCSSGLAPSIRILSLFDADFRLAIWQFNWNSLGGAIR